MEHSLDLRSRLVLLTCQDISSQQTIVSSGQIWTAPSESQDPSHWVIPGKAWDEGQGESPKTSSCVMQIQIVYRDDLGFTQVLGALGLIYMEVP